MEPRGTIYLRLRYTDPHTLYRRRGLPNLRAGYVQLFGADLEAVVAREAKTNPGQAPVPIVLRRCVEEIERRGLDIIGLYRLCGSATKKRLLRYVELRSKHIVFEKYIRNIKSNCNFIFIERHLKGIVELLNSHRIMYPISMLSLEF